MTRSAGVLLHPTSLPGPHGLGEIGPASRHFLDWLERAGFTVWQMLPLGPVEEDGSPYATGSAFARNPLLISLDDLVTAGWLLEAEVPHFGGDPHWVDFSRALTVRAPAIAAASERAAASVDLEAFVAANPWLDDWSTYAAISELYGARWTRWPERLRHRDPDALADVKDRLAARIASHQAAQWLFADQWSNLRKDASSRGISLWGDVPFFVSGDGCDTWAHRELFRMDPDGHVDVVSGVPPDAFAEEGQLWGHPLYDEATHAATGHTWWIDRIGATLGLVDRIRLDHFRGIAAYWEVSAGAPNAMSGHWIPGPGQPLLDHLRAAFGALPFLAEDLGVITPDVAALRDQNRLPGMAILQFAFGQPGWDGDHLPHHHRKDQVVYPGTHDNDTVRGWYDTAPEATRDHVRRYLSVSGADIAGDLTRAALRSVADGCVIQMQDLLRLPGSCRMNVPGRATGNWGWRMLAEALDPGLAGYLNEQIRLAGRTGHDLVSAPEGAP